MPEPGSPVDRIVTFLAANLLWFMLSALIVPLPAATAGLIATFAPWIRGKDTELFSAFFGTMRRQWLKSTVIVLLDAAVGSLIYVNFTALNMMSLDPLFATFLRGLNILIVYIVLTGNIYLWTLLVLFDLPLRRLFNVSFRLALGHPFSSLLTLILTLIPLLILVIIPNVIVLLVIFSASALAINWGGWRIIKKYASPEELADLEQSYRH